MRNHNYTAKLIWLLSELYAWSGDEVYKTALNYKLDKSLIPGVLMDLDENNEVDGMIPTVLFSELTDIAQRPGRMWDGHNALPWYNAMNAWAMTESYVAFRDQGDTEKAEELKPYAVAMLDNLAWEVNNLGVIPDALGVRDLTYAFLIGIWKVAQYEDETHLEWETAAWALWNSGYFNSTSTHSVCVGLYLKIRSETPYTPLFERSDFESIEEIELTNKIRVYPNPSNGIVNLSFDNFDNSDLIVEITNAFGDVVKRSQTNLHQFQLDMTNSAPGIYWVRVFSNNKESHVSAVKFIIH